VDEATFAINEEIIKTGLAKWLEKRAEAAAVPIAGPIITGVELFNGAKLAGELAGGLAGAMIFDHVATRELQRLGQGLLAANQVTRTLADKTFLPQSVVVHAQSDDVGSSLTVIGGSFQRYRNDFALIGNGQSTGQSEFRNSSGQVIASGPINTQNFRDPNGVLIYAESTIALPQGSLFRFAERTGPFMDTFDGDERITSDFDSEFRFSALPENSGSFTPIDDGGSSGNLGGLAVEGNVALMRFDDGRSVLKMTESSPSSIATSITLPATNAVLAFDFQWGGILTPEENANCLAEFITSEFNVMLFQGAASDELLHSDYLLQIVRRVPTELLGQTGVLRFRLDPSTTDGITSEVLLGGFGVFSVIPEPTALTMAGVGFVALLETRRRKKRSKNGVTFRRERKIPGQQ
jgi:hypothetical protein